MSMIIERAAAGAMPPHKKITVVEYGDLVSVLGATDAPAWANLTAEVYDDMVKRAAALATEVKPYEVPRIDDGTGWLDIAKIRDMPFPTMLLVRDQLERDLLEQEQHWRDGAGEHSGIEYRMHTAHANLLYAEIGLVSSLIADHMAWLEVSIAEDEAAVEAQRSELRSMEQANADAAKAARERRDLD